MYLSRLILNAKHSQTRSEVDHPYELHRTICKAFENPENARILFRADTQRPGQVDVIVQSLIIPDWSRLNAEPKYLTRIDEPKEIALGGLKNGMVLKFRARCRPSKRVGDKAREDKGKRRAITDKDEVFAWLHRKAEENGFDVKDVAFDRVYWYESKGGKADKPIGAVQFDGVLVVTDPDKLREAVRNGIGPQKAYGFGLLSLAPLRD